MEMLMKSRAIGFMLCVFGMACSIQATIVDEAKMWYKLNAATSGNVTTAQVVDSIPPAYATYGVGSTTPPTWTTAPDGGDGLLPSDGRAIRLTGSQYGLSIAVKGTASLRDIEAELYGSSTAGATAGSITMWTRVKIDAGTYTWDQPLSLISNANTTSGNGVIFRLIGSNNSSAVRLNVQLGNGTSFSTYYNNGLDAKIGEWADVAFSYDAANLKLILSVYNGTTFETAEFDVSAANALKVPGYLTTTPVGASFYVGSNAVSAEVLPGEMESFVIWNKALTTSELQSLSIPEPATMALLGLGSVFFIRRKK